MSSRFPQNRDRTGEIPQEIAFRGRIPQDYPAEFAIELLPPLEPSGSPRTARTLFTAPTISDRPCCSIFHCRGDVPGLYNPVHPHTTTGRVMNAPLYVTPPMSLPVPEPTAPAREAVDLLRQLVGLQQEQISLAKAQAAGQDAGARWRAFLARWESEFPEIGSACRQSIPTLERAYLGLIREVTERVNSAEPGEFDNEFALGEFLDRFGIRLGQLGNILSQLAPLADAAGGESVKG